MRHFCASAYVIDPSTKKILLVKHKKFNRWVQPGGHVEENETFEETALRETYEETQIKVTLIGEHFPRENDFIRPLGIQKNYGTIPGDTHIDVIYAAIPNKESIIEYDCNESTGAKWFTREELDDINCFPDIKITMDYILKNLIR